VVKAEPLRSGKVCVRDRSAWARSTVVPLRPFVDRDGLLLTVVAHIRVNGTCLCVLIASGFGEMLSLDGLSLRVGLRLSRLGGAFLGFSLRTLSFGALFVG
jgi:hypothetical protein